jgi:cation/acetate symporter
MISICRKGSVAALLALFALTATPVYAQAGPGEGSRLLTFSVFAVIIAITMYVTYLAAKRVHSASDFYTAGGGVSGWQNGWAIA